MHIQLYMLSHHISLHSGMYLPTATIILPLNGANSNWLSSRTPTCDQHFKWWYSSVKRMRSIPSHLNTIIQNAHRMLEPCHLTSLNYLIQRKTIVAVGRLYRTFVPSNYNNCLTFEWGKFKHAKHQESNIRPVFPSFHSKD